MSTAAIPISTSCSSSRRPSSTTRSARRSCTRCSSSSRAGDLCADLAAGLHQRRRAAGRRVGVRPDPGLSPIPRPTRTSRSRAPELRDVVEHRDTYRQGTAGVMGFAAAQTAILQGLRQNGREHMGRLEWRKLDDRGFPHEATADPARSSLRARRAWRWRPARRGLAFAAAPEGQLTWGVHVSLAPTWFDPAETPGIITPFMVLYALHDAMVKPMPGEPMAPCLAESWSASEDGLHLRLRAAQRRQVPQWRAGHRRGRQILLRALPGHLARFDEGAGGGDRNPRPAACALPAEKAVARFPDLLCDRQRRRLDRAQEICREGRRRRVQKGADRRRALQIRLVHPGCRTGARGLRPVLAQDPERQAAGDAR